MYGTMGDFTVLWGRTVGYPDRLLPRRTLPIVVSSEHWRTEKYSGIEKRGEF